jgi:hypothetical protein
MGRAALGRPRRPRSNAGRRRAPRRSFLRYRRCQGSAGQKSGPAVGSKGRTPFSSWRSDEMVPLTCLRRRLSPPSGRCSGSACRGVREVFAEGPLVGRPERLQRNVDPGDGKEGGGALAPDPGEVFHGHVDGVRLQLHQQVEAAAAALQTLLEVVGEKVRRVGRRRRAARRGTGLGRAPSFEQHAAGLSPLGRRGGEPFAGVAVALFGDVVEGEELDDDVVAGVGAHGH